eukprot:COSAG03_NODE_9942_length_683_cov_1.157534_2_plen_85_part_01
MCVCVCVFMPIGAQSSAGNTNDCGTTTYIIYIPRYHIVRSRYGQDSAVERAELALTNKARELDEAERQVRISDCAQSNLHTNLKS